MRSLLCAVMLSFAALATPSHAEPRPLWEFGLGPTFLSLPDYRGSDEARGYIYPFPYVVYRGDFFRVDRQGLRGIFFESDRVKLDISAFATPPVDSEKNRTRQGMPDLDPTIEVGPLLNVTLARDRKKEWALELRIPVRAVIATDFSETRSAGFVFYPHINLDLRPTFLDGKWNFGVQAGPLYGTRNYHQYFYGVDAQFATPDRPAYDARGGYSGTLALTSVSRRFRNFWIGGFMRYDTLKGAVFEDSPLVKRDHSFMAGIAIAWVFAESSRTVEADD
jgi:MipA family protein